MKERKRKKGLRKKIMTICNEILCGELLEKKWAEKKAVGGTTYYVIRADFA